MPGLGQWSAACGGMLWEVRTGGIVLEKQGQWREDKGAEPQFSIAGSRGRDARRRKGQGWVSEQNKGHESRRQMSRWA